MSDYLSRLDATVGRQNAELVDAAARRSAALTSRRSIVSKLQAEFSEFGQGCAARLRQARVTPMASGKPVERRRSLRQAETVVTPGPAYWHLAGFSYNLFLSVDGALGIGRWSGLRIRNGRVGREMRHGGLHELRWLPDPPAYRFQRDALLIGEVSPLNLAHIAEREPGTGEDGLRLHDDKLVWQSTNFEDGSYHFEDVANSALQTVATLLAGK